MEMLLTIQGYQKWLEYTGQSTRDERAEQKES